jgi:hypothetical protein
LGSSSVTRVVIEVGAEPGSFRAIEANRSRHLPFEITGLIFWCE